MLTTLRTLWLGAGARAEERVRDAYAIELIDQKIREADLQLRAAKGTLASLIQRKRAESGLADGLKERIADLETRTRAALAAGDEATARDGAEAIAGLENELELRRKTVTRLAEKVDRLTRSVEAGQRRIVELRQGAVSARAIRREAEIQSRLSTTLAGQSSADEAEALIARVTEADDPFEQSQILSEIEAGLSKDGLADQMAEKGYGPATKSRADDVLARLRSNS
ncbi:MAG: PspA/IM30 family protein [Pseudomonadota bacterium]